ncbi:hypothetical protein PAGL106935_04955 [Paenibacillus glucanolyticus]
MLAVEWPDVDHERSAIWIVKQITLDEEGNKIEGDVKTDAAARVRHGSQNHTGEIAAYEDGHEGQHLYT